MLRRLVLVTAIGFAHCAGAALPAAVAPAIAASPAQILVGEFEESSGQELPTGWQPLQFRKVQQHTQYRLQKVDGRTVLCASAKASASGLIRPMQVDLQRYPYLNWQWKVDNLVATSDVHLKSGDDYPARIYVTFAVEPDKIGFFDKMQFEAIKLLYGEYPPAAALNYIWATHAAVGDIVENAFTSRAMMIVVDSGLSHLQQWRHYSRNLLEDYRAAFGGDPPPLSGVAVMTDTDNTGENAHACYGDIYFSSTGGER